MSDASLTNDQARKLLHELASNSGFRKRFEEKPAAALIELGIPHETVVNLNPACLAPVRLNEKALATALSEIQKTGLDAYLSMVVPQLKL